MRTRQALAEGHAGSDDQHMWEEHGGDARLAPKPCRKTEQKLLQSAHPQASEHSGGGNRRHRLGAGYSSAFFPLHRTGKERGVGAPQRSASAGEEPLDRTADPQRKRNEQGARNGLWRAVAEDFDDLSGHGHDGHRRDGRAGAEGRDERPSGRLHSAR